MWRVGDELSHQLQFQENDKSFSALIKARWIYSHSWLLIRHTLTSKKHFVTTKGIVFFDPIRRSCTHEETDTRILLHLDDAVQQGGKQAVDTDVLVQSWHQQSAITTLNNGLPWSWEEPLVHPCSWDHETSGSWAVCGLADVPCFHWFWHDFLLWRKGEEDCMVNLSRSHSSVLHLSLEYSILSASTTDKHRKSKDIWVSTFDFRIWITWSLSRPAYSLVALSCSLHLFFRLLKCGKNACNLHGARCACGEIFYKKLLQAHIKPITSFLSKSLPLISIIRRCNNLPPSHKSLKFKDLNMNLIISHINYWSSIVLIT